MAAVTLHAASPAKGAFRPAYANGHHKTVSGTLAFDDSYPTGGESIADITGQFRTCQGIVFQPKAGYTFDADIANNKVIAYWVDTSTDGAAQAEVTDETDLSALTAVPFLAWGV